MLVYRFEKQLQASPRNWRYFQNHTFSMIITKMDIEETKDHILQVSATVEEYGRNNLVTMILDKSGNILSHSCDCQWDSPRDACGHTLFVAEELAGLSLSDIPYHTDLEEDRKEEKRKQEEFLKQYYERQRLEKLELSHQMLKSAESAASELHLNLVQKGSVHLEANSVFTSDWRWSGIEMTFRIGTASMYYIKDLGQFLDNIDGGSEFSYGKKLTLVHSEEMLDEKSKIILAFIRQYYKAPNEDDPSVSKKKNLIRIRNRDIEAYIQLWKEVPINGVSVRKDDRRITIVFQPNRDGTMVIPTVKAKTEKYSMSGKAYYIIEHGTIYDTPVNDSRQAFSLMSALVKNEYTEMSLEDASKLAKLIMRFPECFEVEGIRIPEADKTEEKINVYFDIDSDDELYALIQYVYPEGNRYGFDEDNCDLSAEANQIESFLKRYASRIDSESRRAYYSLNDENTYALVETGIPAIQKAATVFASEAVRNLHHKSKYHFTVGVSVKNSLLEVDISSIELPKEEIGDILKSYRRKKKFYKLKNGQTISLGSDDLEELDDLFETNAIDPSSLKDGMASLPAFRAFDFENDRDNAHIELVRSRSYQSLLERLKDVNSEPAAVPSEYESVLRSYQKFGMQWMHLLSQYGFGGILADDMGLGKTIQVLALLETEKDEKKCSIVVCPSSLILNWKDEAQKFNSPLNVVCVLGSQAKRERIIAESGDADLLITSYDYMRNDASLYEKREFFYAILDEAQYIKNQSTLNAKSVKKLKAKHRLALTGTPIENSIAELWSIFDFVMPQYLYNYHYFKGKYETPIIKDHDEEAQKKLKKMVEPFILRRTKKEVLKDLPEKIEQVLPLEFSEEEQKLYLANLSTVNTELQNLLQAEHPDKIAILAMLTRLRQICCDARLVYENIHTPSSKMDGCMDLIRQMQDAGRKVIVFSSFTSILSLLEEELKKEKITYCCLTGATAKEERRRLVNDFQTDDTQVFLISLKAGGTGLNITAASCVIHFDPWWNVSAQNQATDRAYRIGQMQDVLVYKLIMKGSIEEKIMKMQERKKSISDTFVENSDGSLMSMDTETLVDLLSQS